MSAPTVHPHRAPSPRLAALLPAALGCCGHGRGSCMRAVRTTHRSR